MTLIEMIEQAERQFIEAGVSFGHGTTNAFDEAAWLVLWACKLPLDTDLTDQRPDSVANRLLAGIESARAATILRARIDTRQPAAYLTKEAWLQGVPFYVDERVIVPRSLIAEVIADGSIDPWLPEPPRRILDLCTGNGSLAVLAALAYPDAQIDAADISSDALAVAKINIEKHNLQNRIHLIQSDGLTHCPGAYDLILCNPPYVNAQSMAQLPPEYQAEPSLALAGGKDGMDFIRPLLARAHKHMSESGVLVLEIGNERENFEQAFSKTQVIWLETSAGDDQLLLHTSTRPG
jgi:ribosomal protein L3 glutamine methyltransferase